MERVQENAAPSRRAREAASSAVSASGSPFLQRAHEDFERRCAVLRDRLASDDFLNNRGLGNEVGFFTFCYHPALELELRAFVADLQAQSDAGKLPCRIIVRNLYDAFLSICEKKRILGAIPKQEAKHGSDRQLKQLAKIATPEAFARELDYEPHGPRDVLVITGVGEAYPFLRVHALLENVQHLFPDTPVVVAYPGVFDGQTFSLFGRLKDGNYYRAFDIS